MKKTLKISETILVKSLVRRERRRGIFEIIRINADFRNLDGTDNVNLDERLDGFISFASLGIPIANLPRTAYFAKTMNIGQFNLLLKGTHFTKLSLASRSIILKKLNLVTKFTLKSHFSVTTKMSKLGGGFINDKVLNKKRKK
jgi:hypothetical protein